MNATENNSQHPSSVLYTLYLACPWFYLQPDLWHHDGRMSFDVFQTSISSLRNQAGELIICYDLLRRTAGLSRQRFSATKQ